MSTSPDQSPTEEEFPTVIYLVDDDVSYLRSCSRLLRAAGFNVVIHNSAAEFLLELRADMSGCVITDLMMPGMNGIELQEALAKKDSALPVIFLTGQGDIPITVKAMRAGAEDFLTKNAPKEELFAAIGRALAHHAEHRETLARLEELRRPFELLSVREREVLQHVVRGQLNKQIAADLGIHERTVKLHRTHITTKLAVHSVAELTRMVQNAGLFEDWDRA